LMHAARNRAVDIIRRERVRTRFAKDLSPLLETEWTLGPTLDALFAEDEIRDDELRMMFACCDPRIAPEAQIAVILKLLCGFGVGEVAHALLASEAAIEKKIARAKAVLRRAGHLPPDATAEQIGKRLEAVCQAVYLLFNEGYHGSHPE